MSTGSTLRFDRFVVIACGVGAAVSLGLTLGAADLDVAGVPVAAKVALFGIGLAPYGLTAVLSAIRPFRRLVVATTRVAAVLYGVADCTLRYLALYHPTGSTDALVIVGLPLWWLPTMLIVAAVTAGVQRVLPEPIRAGSTPSRV